MAINRCFNCSVIDETHAHHVVPKSKGGLATVNLCVKCHSIAHSHRGMSTGALTSAAMQSMKANNLYTGGKVPYGKSLMNGTLVNNESEQAIIRKAKALRAEGCSLRTIATLFSEQGYKTRKDTEFSHVLIQRMVARHDNEY